MIKSTIFCFLTAIIVFYSANSFSETLNMATLNWEPFYGEKLPENGFFSALAKEAFKRAGYKVKIFFMPWKRALDSAGKGKYDGLMGAYYNEDRAKIFYFTDPVAQNEEVFVHNKGLEIEYNNLEDLKKYKIGGVRGSAQIKDLRNMGFNTEVTTNYRSAIRKLKLSRVEILVIGKQKLLYDLKNDTELKQYENAFEILDPPFKTYEIFCPITKKRADGAKIVENFNKGLREMIEDGTYDRILERFGQK